MRRLGLFAGFLLLLGLTTAVAASFDVQAEDVTSFSAPVSISVPTTPPPPPGTPFPSTLYVRGDESAANGQIDLVAPASNDSVQRKEIKRDVLAVDQQTDATKYHTWQSPTAPSGGYLLDGTVTLYISQNNGGTNRMTAGLFDCAPSVAPDSVHASCTLIRVAVGDPGGSGSGFQERVVQFGSVTVTIPAGNQLRLKIVNRGEQPPGTVVSNDDWNLQWGFLPARQSRLEIAAP